VFDDERAGIAWLQEILAFLRAASAGDAADRATPELEKLVPVAERRAYDMKKVVDALFDRGTVLELSPAFAPNLLTVLARLGGRTVAVLASQPMKLAGCLDINSSRKGAAFVRWANARRIPILTLVDVPGYLPGRKQEEGGILPHGAELLDAYGAATVPMLCLILRKSYGGASVLSFASEIRLALPMASVGPMGAEATLEVVVGPRPTENPEAWDQRRVEWLARHSGAYAAAADAYVDRVIAPAAARRELSMTLERMVAGRG
jgi:propionyl-CoA carboxylase beta chain